MRISDWSSDVCSSDLDGTVNVRLDNSNGPLLVDQMGPKLLGAAEANGQIQLTLDPFGNSGLVSVPSTGAIAGLADAYVQLSDSDPALDTLGKQFFTTVNAAHRPGGDLAGRPGPGLSSPESLAATPVRTEAGPA